MELGQEHGVEPLPDSRSLSGAPVSPTRHLGATAQLLGKHGLGNPALQDQQEAG